MTRGECVTQMVLFKTGFVVYRDALANPNYDLDPSVRRTFLESQRSMLNQTYGKLEKYVDIFGRGVSYIPALGDGFSDDILSSVSSVIQNLDRIIGRLSAISDSDFDEQMRPQPAVSAAQAPATAPTISDLRHPHRQYWGRLFVDVCRWIRIHILETVVVGVVIGLLVAYLSYRFGWVRA